MGKSKKKKTYFSDHFLDKPPKTVFFFWFSNHWLITVHRRREKEKKEEKKQMKKVGLQNRFFIAFLEFLGDLIFSRKFLKFIHHQWSCTLHNAMRSNRQ